MYILRENNEIFCFYHLLRNINVSLLESRELFDFDILQELLIKKKTIKRDSREFACHCSIIKKKKIKTFLIG